LDSFVFTGGSGGDHVVRWSLVPVSQPVYVSATDRAKWPDDFLEREIAQRIAIAPQQWKMIVTLADPGDSTDNPSKSWPDGRRTVDVGTLVASKILAEPDGPCREINYDPTVLSAGLRTSNDPFPSARSAAYAVSYDRRTAEANAYPSSGTGAPQ
jgi:catalase